MASLDAAVLEAQREKLKEQESEILRLRAQLNEVSCGFMRGPVLNLAAPGTTWSTSVAVADLTGDLDGAVSRDVTPDRGIGELRTVPQRRGLHRSRSFIEGELREGEEVQTKLQARIDALEAQLEAVLSPDMSAISTFACAELMSTALPSRRLRRLEPRASSDQAAHEKRVGMLEDELKILSEEVEEGEQRERQLLQKVEDLEQKNDDLQTNAGQHLEVVAKLEDQIKESKDHLKESANRYSEIWRQAKEYQEMLAATKEMIKSLEEQHIAELRMAGGRSRAPSVRSRGLTAEIDMDADGTYSQCAEATGSDEEAEGLREELESATSALQEALRERDEFAAMVGALRQDLQTASQRLDEQVKVTHGLADQERTLRRNLSELVIRPGAQRRTLDGVGAGDNYLKLLAQLGPVEHSLQEVLQKQLDLAERECQALNEVVRSSQALDAELRKKHEMLLREEDLHQQLGKAHTALRERLAQLAGSSPEAVARRAQLTSLDAELQETLNSLGAAAGSEHGLPEQLEGSDKSWLEQRRQHLQRIIVEADLRQTSLRCRCKVREEHAGSGIKASPEEVLAVLKMHLEVAGGHLEAAHRSSADLEQGEAHARELAAASSTRLQAQIESRAELVRPERSLLELLKKVGEQPPLDGIAGQIDELKVLLARAEDQLKETQASTTKFARAIESCAQRLQEQDPVRVELESVVEALRNEWAGTPRPREPRGVVDRGGSGSGPDDAAGGAAAASSSAAAVDGAAGESTMRPSKSHMERLRLREQLLVIRSELRDLVHAMLEDWLLDPEPEPAPMAPSSLLFDFWSGSAKRIMCCREDVGRVDDASARTLRRRELLLTIAERLEETPPELQTFAQTPPAFQAFDPTSFDES